MIGDVTDETLYRLINPGADGIFESNLSNGCLFGLQGDDISINIDKANYVPGAILTRLDVNAGQALMTGKYSLLVCGSTGPESITDLEGNQLDGNGDGIAGDDFVLNFTVSVSDDLCFPVRLQNSGVAMVCL